MKNPFNVAITLAVLGLTGCAGQANFENCSDALSMDNPMESLARLTRYAQNESKPGACQRAYSLALNRVVALHLGTADRARTDGRADEAAAAYRTALELQPENAQARQGLRVLERETRLRSLLDDARRWLDQRSFQQARAVIDSVLRMDPGNAEALALQGTLAALVAPVPSSGLTAAFKKTVSIEFRDAPLRMLFDALSKSSGLNFVFDKDVKTDQKASILLRDSSVEQGLFFLLLTNQLEHQVMNGNTVLIYPNNPAKQKEYQELNVRTFQMANTDVKAVAAALKTLFKGRDIVVDEKQNMLVVRDTPEAIRMVEKLVALHDIAEPEVMLEVAILEVSRRRLLKLGIDLPDSLSLSPLASNAATGLTLDDLRGVNGSRLGATVGPVTLRANKQDTDVNILANPRIRVINKEKAKVLIGEKVPVITVTTSPQGGFAESVTYVEVGLKLEVEPTIYRGNDVVIRINLEVSNISGQTLSKLGGVAYTFGNRTANTTLRLKDGENQVLAGLINDEDRKVASKVPGVGDLPVLNRLFGSAQDDGNKTEIMLSITPRLVRNNQRYDAGAQEFRSGTENSPRERPVQAPEPVAAPFPGTPVPAPVTAPASAAPVVLLPPKEPALPPGGVPPAVIASKVTATRLDDAEYAP